jgi:hypothetical protein
VEKGRRRKSDIQNCSFENAMVQISACIHENEISMAISLFPGSGNMTGLLRRLPHMWIKGTENGGIQ